MIVARSFSPPSSSFMSEKIRPTDRSSRPTSRQQSRSPQRSASASNRKSTPSSPELRSDPVKIPSRKPRNSPLPTSNRPLPTTVQPAVPTDRQAQTYKPRKESAQELLSATTIPIRRKPKGRLSQRLPKGDHVADFSKFLLDDFQPSRDGGYVRNQSLPQIDGLFGNIDELVEGQIFVGSEGLDEGTLSARSISSESLASLASPEDFSVEYRSGIGRSLQGRQTPRISHSEDCSGDHPLVDLDKIDDLSLGSPESASTPTLSPSPRATSPTPRTSKKEPSRSTFKSSLTASLKALKSAARTTLLSSSGYGHGGAGSSGVYTNESLLAHNFFDIQPSLTDDRRPPPTMTRPSPELRRYLNPQMTTAPDSPTQLHFWQDERDTYDTKREAQIIKEKIKQRTKRRRSPGPKSKIDLLPPVVPLSTCLPPTVRTANASSPPIWLTPDGEPMNKNTSSSISNDSTALSTNNNGMPKNREPRENRDFLRMYVCETAMRRQGKLKDDLSAGRARLWLPPLPGFQTANSGAQPTRKEGAVRMKSWTLDDMMDEGR